MSSDLEQQFGEYDYINDLDRGANNLIEFVKYSPNIIALINSVMPEVQELHDAQKDVYSTINIFEAVGSQLDDIFGTLLDLERTSGQSDDSYRLDLLSQATVLSRSGEISVVKSLYRNLLSATSVQLFEFQPAAFKMDAIASVIPSVTELQKIRESLEKAKQTGNNMALTITSSTTPFELEELTSPSLNDVNGLSGDSFDGGTLLQGF